MVNVICPICGENATKSSTREVDIIDCPVCHEYTIGNGLKTPDLSEYDKSILKTYCYRYMKSDGIHRPKPITKENKNEIINSINPPRTLIDKINFVVKYLADSTQFFGDTIDIPRPHGHRLFFCKNENELQNILESIKEQGYITGNEVSILDTIDTSLPPRKIIMTSRGLQYAETLFNRSFSTQCFVAMWFNESTQQLYEKIQNAVTGTPTADKNSVKYGANYTIMKIDEKDHINYIPAEIISEIKRSRFMIADLSGYRGGVYYEAGFAEGLGIPVILTCSKEWFEEHTDEQGNKCSGVHFDLKQKNILLWENDKLDIFQRKLVARIGEIVGFN